MSLIRKAVLTALLGGLLSQLGWHSELAAAGEVPPVSGGRELIFPLFDEEGGAFTGLAFTNSGPDTVGLGIEVRQDDGGRLAAPDNPALVVLEAGRQLARLGFELIGPSPAEERRGWVRVDASSDQVAAFSLVGRVGEEEITQLDGALAGRATEETYCFSRVYEGVQVFPTLAGPQDAATTLAIANPGLETVDLTLRLFNELGQELAASSRSIPAQGRLLETISDLFDQDALSNHYVCVESLGGASAGLELIQLPETMMVLAGATPGDASSLFSAQLAHGESIFTSLKLLNPTSEQRAVILTAFIQGPGGEVSSRVVALTLQVGQSFQRNVDQIFALGAGGSEVIVGSIQVETTPAGLIGDVIFGDPQAAAFAAALPLQSTAFTEAVFSHLANGPTNVESPSFDPFTGIAVFNPNTSGVSVTVQVFEPDGDLAGSKVVSLAARQRFSEVIEVLIPETAELTAGFVRLSATGPVIAQQIFGNNSLQFFSAIPAQILVAATPE